MPPTIVRVVYQARPTGYHLARALATAKIDCDNFAMSKLILPAGDNVKTDKRDAEFLARLTAVSEYTTVCISTVEAESARDLVRAHDDIRQSPASKLSRFPVGTGSVGTSFPPMGEA